MRRLGYGVAGKALISTALPLPITTLPENLQIEQRQQAERGGGVWRTP